MEDRLERSDSSDGEPSSPISSTEDSRPVLKLSPGMMIALTCGIGGLQLVWSTIFSHGSAYLFSLGITKSQSSLIWAIAPICGTVVQPVVGALSDNCRFRWGRRRPFILGGAIGVVLCITAWAWIGNIMRGLAAVFGVGSDAGIKTMVQVGCIVCITLLNISIQPLQLGLRALIVDVCPSERQSVASAWAGRFTSVSNILGYILGSVSLGSVSRDSEVGRFRFLSLIAIVALIATLSVTTYLIREEDPRELPHKHQGRTFLLGTLLNLRDGWAKMPIQSRRVCFVQFFAWLGWFGYLFYSTSYVGRLYVAQAHSRDVQDSDALKDAGIRLGTFASLLSAIAALVTTAVAPRIASPAPTAIVSGIVAPKDRIRWWRQTHIIWAFSHLLYTCCTFSTLLISSTNMAVFIIALIGISWGVTQWAPFALLGEDIATHSTTTRRDQQWTTNQSGAIMGVHNAAISIPQILAALGSSLIFWVFEGNGSDEDNSIAWVLASSGIAALFAAYFASRLK